jgi:hypothetical protein
VLLKKKSEAIEVKDYRLISLIHSFGKLFDKVLSSQLAPHMDALVMPNQSAFIKGRAIHDNFIAVWSMAKLLHARRCSYVLLKIDIAKAFDTVTWAFLLDLPRHIGFSAKWISWVSMLLSTASTKILINGRPSQRICQARGLRQGDPLSPFLFVLTMEALNAMFKEADARGLLSPLRVPAIHHRVSLHAGDLVIFVLPTESDILLCCRPSSKLLQAPLASILTSVSVRSHPSDTVRIRLPLFNISFLVSLSTFLAVIWESTSRCTSLRRVSSSLLLMWWPDGCQPGKPG